MAEKMLGDSLPKGRNRSPHRSTISTVDAVSQRPRASYQQVLQKCAAAGVKTNYDSLHRRGSGADSALIDSGFSDSFDSSCCMVSDSEQEVHKSAGYEAGCREPVKFFVGLDSDSDSESDSDEFFTADECSEASEETSEDEDVSVTFSDDLCCSFNSQSQLSRSLSWTAPERTSYHSRCLPQSFSASSVRRLVGLGSNSESEVAELKTGKQVQFQDNPEVHCIVAWNYAYRAARKGPWEKLAVSRDRFKKRVEESEQIFSHIFSVQHREKILAMQGFVGQEANQCHGQSGTFLKGGIDNV